MNMRSAHHAAIPALRPLVQPGIAEALAAPLRMVGLWLSRRRERKELLGLDDHMLRDIGLDRVRAERLAARPFWRA